MKLEEMYAHALYRSDTKEPKKVLEALRSSLKHRGHEKLLPKIFAEYQKLQVRKARSDMHQKITPERERTRTLLELYRKLIATN